MLPLSDLRAASAVTADNGDVARSSVRLSCRGTALPQEVNSSNNFPIRKWPSFLVGHFFCTPSVPATSIAHAIVFGRTGNTRQPKLS